MRLRPRTTTHSTTLESTTRLLLSHSTVTQPQKLKTSILDASIEYENGAMKHARALALSLRSDAVPPVPVANASGRRTYAETGFGIEAWFFSWLARLSLREWSSLVGTRVLARLVGWRVANNSSLSTSNPSQSPTQTWPATSPATLTPAHARSCKHKRLYRSLTDKQAHGNEIEGSSAVFTSSRGERRPEKTPRL